MMPLPLLSALLLVLGAAGSSADADALRAGSAGPPFVPLVMHKLDNCTQCGHDWCAAAPRCTAFEFDNDHVEGAALSVTGCDAICPATAPTFCYRGDAKERYTATHSCKHCPPPPPCLEPRPT